MSLIKGTIHKIVTIFYATFFSYRKIGHFYGKIGLLFVITNCYTIIVQ